ncbi:MAG: hypothetical protein JNK67_23090 [Alphaproteobacteria bacterium]|nr:hypothetical protein [Alphaproteobacteria bacterium]
MTGFRASALGALIALAFGGVASAQLGAPYRLIPGGDNPGTIAPQPGLPKTEDQVVRDEGLLRAPDAGSAGILDARNGGLPPTIWTGATRGGVDPLLAQIAPTRLPALGELARRAAASTATPPAADGAEAPPAFAPLRARALLRLGDIAGARALADRLSRGQPDAATRAVTRDSLFLLNDADGACALVQETNADGADWQQALIACQALANDQTRAQLGLTLLREQQGAEDDWLDRLIAYAGGAKRALEGGRGELRPHHLPLFAAAKAAPPVAAIEAAGPAVQAAIALNDAFAAETRLRAAEPAAAAHAIDGEALATLYDGQPLNARESADAIAFAERERGPRARAALYKAIKSQPAGPERAAFIDKAMAIAERRGATTLVAFRRAILDLAEPIPASSIAIDHAEAMARVLLGEGRTQAASRWLDMLRPGSGFGARAAMVAPLMALGGAADRNFLSDETLHQWRAGHGVGDTARANQRVRLLAEIFDALGLPTSELQGAGTPTAVASPALVARLSRAALEKHVGETILLANAVLADPALRDNPTAIGAVIRAVNGVGLGAEARAIGLDAALAGGL